MDAAKIIESLRKLFSVETDSDLAKCLQVDKSTISSWRVRGNVPPRYLRILDGDSPKPSASAPSRWGSHEVMAFRLALFHYVRARAEVVSRGDYQELLQTFSYEEGFFNLMLDAQRRLSEKIDSTGVDLPTAFALVLHQELTGSDDGAARDRAILRTLPDFPEGVESRL